MFQYMQQGDRWDQLGEDVDGEDAFDAFGNSIAMSADGSIVKYCTVNNLYHEISLRKAKKLAKMENFAKSV